MSKTETAASTARARVCNSTPIPTLCLPPFAMALHIEEALPVHANTVVFTFIGLGFPTPAPLVLQAPATTSEISYSPPVEPFGLLTFANKNTPAVESTANAPQAPAPAPTASFCLSHTTPIRSACWTPLAFSANIENSLLVQPTMHFLRSFTPSPLVVTTDSSTS